jgi:hypothetical protein
MRCKKVIKKLDRFIEKSLIASENSIISEHLQQCMSCLSELNRIRKLENLFSEEMITNIPESVKNDISEIVNKRKILYARVSKSVFSWLTFVPVRTRIAFAAVVLLAVLSGFKMSSDVWSYRVNEQAKNGSEIVENIYTLESFSGDSDGSLFNLYSKIVLSSDEAIIR